MVFVETVTLGFADPFLFFQLDIFPEIQERNLSLEITYHVRVRHQIDREADDGPVSGVLDLRDVLKLTVDGLDQSPLAQEDFVRDCHKLALHVALKLCYQLGAVHETDARAGSHAASIHEQDEGDRHLTEIHQTFYDVNESSFLHLYFPMSVFVFLLIFIVTYIISVNILENTFGSS